MPSFIARALTPFPLGSETQKKPRQNRVNIVLFFRSAILVPGWNVTIVNPLSTSFTLQWSSLRRNINRFATFYIVLIKSSTGDLLAVEIVTGNSSTITVKGLRPSTQYRAGVYGIDDVGQAYKGVESLTSTTNGMSKYISVSFKGAYSRRFSSL